jgi:hypothetical protein
MHFYHFPVSEYFLHLTILSILKDSPGAAVKLLPCDNEVMG